MQRALITLVLLLTAYPLTAAIVNVGLSFSPTGGPIDADPIFDISHPPDPIVFEVTLDTRDLLLRLDNFQYRVTFDTTELKLTGIFLNRFDNEHDVLFTLGAGVVDVSHFSLSHVPFPAGVTKLGTYTFSLKNLKDDGLSDFRTEMISAISEGLSIDYTHMFFPQEVEVQPFPEPGTLTLAMASLSAMILFGFVAKRRSQINSITPLDQVATITKPL